MTKTRASGRSPRASSSSEPRGGGGRSTKLGFTTPAAKQETGRRAVRVAGRVQEEVARCLRELEDDGLAGVVVTRVELTDDLAFARVYVRRLTAEIPGEEERRALERVLGAVTGRVRRDVGRVLGIARGPELRFAYDTGLDNSARVEELLREIAREGGGSGG